jgi:hypothetical protein
MTDKTKHTPLPWVESKLHIASAAETFQFDGQPINQRVALAIVNYKQCNEPMQGRPEANTAFIIKACNAYYQNQDTIDNLIAAFEPILELAKRKADLPAQLGIIVAADKALEKAKGQS